jgi:predicted DsbA family dithiol-disulfide isomerase
VRIEKLKANYDLDLEYVHFPLHPDTPPEGRALLDLFGGPAAAQRVEDSYRRLKGLADQEGLPLAKRTMTYNTRLAQELGVWARREGAGDAFDSAVFRAYFADARDISKPEVLV